MKANTQKHKSTHNLAETFRNTKKPKQTHIDQKAQTPKKTQTIPHKKAKAITNTHKTTKII